MKHGVLSLLIGASLSGCTTIPDLEPEDRLACSRSLWGFHGAMCSRPIQLHKQELAVALVQAFLDDGALFGVELEPDAAACRPKHQASSCETLAALPWHCDVEVCAPAMERGCGYVALLLEGEDVTESDLDSCRPDSPCGVGASERRVTRAVERGLDGAEADVVLEFRKVDGESKVLWCATTTEAPRRRALVDALSGKALGAGAVRPQ